MKSPEPVEPVTALVVLTTLGSEEGARALVHALVEKRMIACGTLLGGRSIYRWEGEIREEQEVVVLLKTDSSKWNDLAAQVRKLHPYEVPELLAIPASHGLESYLAWLATEVGA